MAPFFYMLWMLLGGVVVVGLASALAASLIVLIVASIKKWRLAQMISGIFLILAVLASVSFTYRFLLDPDPKNVFESVFGNATQANVQSLKCHTLWIGDTQVLWLQFKTDEAEFRKLLPVELHPNTDAYFHLKDETGGPNSPEWWIPGDEKQTIVYIVRQSPGKTFGGETTIMAYDREQHCVYYYFCGVD